MTVPSPTNFGITLVRTSICRCKIAQYVPPLQPHLKAATTHYTAHISPVVMLHIKTTEISCETEVSQKVRRRELVNSCFLNMMQNYLSRYQIWQVRDQPEKPGEHCQPAVICQSPADKHRTSCNHLVTDHKIFLSGG